MGLTRNAQIKRAEAVGLVIAKDFFETFQDPLMRGKNFTWDKFPAIVAGFARTQVVLSFPHKISPEIIAHAEFVAKATAIKLRDEFLSKLKKPLDK